MRTIHIYETQMNEFVTKFDNLVKIAGKLGCDTPTYKIVSTEKRKRDDLYLEIIHTIELDYNVVINGFQYVAYFDHDENVVFGEYPTNLFNPSVCKCDHCSVNRYRSKTFIIKNGDEFKQVGGTCLINYLGHDIRMSSLHDIFDELAGLDSFGLESGGCGKQYYDVMTVLRFAIGSVRTYGFHKTSSETPTKLHVLQIYNGMSKKPDYEVTKDEIDQLIQYMLSFENSEVGSYESNLYNIAKNGYCSDNTLGILVSVVSSYDSYKKRQLELELERNSQYVGVLKKRMNFDVTMISVYILENFYGFMSIVKMLDENGNILIWKASGSKSFDIGAKYKLTGTVSEHSEYEGKKQTLLQRCKLEIVE